MSKRIKLRIRIEILRELMHEIIEEEENLVNWRVVKISQELDVVINEYNSMRCLSI